MPRRDRQRWCTRRLEPARSCGQDLEHGDHRSRQGSCERAACESYAIRAARQPEVQGAVTEDANEDYFGCCLDLEDEQKGTPLGEVDVNDEEDDDDNSYL